MSYTDYPRQANVFSNSCNAINGNIDTITSKLEASNSILSSGNSIDLIVTRSSEATSDIINRIRSYKNGIDASVEHVNKLATQLENKAMMEALANQEEESGD
jgi:hypothetical protein